MDRGAGNYRRFLSGDDQGIVEIVKEYKDGLILFLNGYVRNIHIAEELAEDTFFVLLVKKPKYSPKYSFKTWLYTIGRNRALTYLSRQSRFADVTIEQLDVLYQQEAESLEKAYIKKDEKLRLRHAIGVLAPQYGEILYLAYFELLSNQELCYVLKKTPKQISNLLYRAKQSLKEELIKEGFEYEVI